MLESVDAGREQLNELNKLSSVNNILIVCMQTFCLAGLYIYIMYYVWNLGKPILERIIYLEIYMYIFTCIQLYGNKYAYNIFNNLQYLAIFYSILISYKYYFIIEH